MSGRADDRRRTFAVAAVAAILIARQLHWLWTGCFNEDELENLQVLWLTHHGWIFGRDYVTSHLPAFPLLLEPLYRWFGPTPALPVAVRIAMTPAVAWTLGEIFLLARDVGEGPSSGWFAIVLLLASPTLAVSMVEARPDAVALPLALAGLRCFRHSSTAPRSNRLLIGSGALYGLSLLFNPKAVFLALATLWAAARQRRDASDEPWNARAAPLAGYVLATIAPFVTIAAGLALRGWISTADLEVFLTTGYRWLDPARLTGYKIFLLERIVGLAPLALVLGVLALVRDRPGRDDRADGSWSAVWLASIAYIAQIVVSAVVVTQMLLLPSVLLASGAARLLRRSGSLVTAGIAVAAALAPALLVPEDQSGRNEQLERLAFVLRNVPENRPVIDGRFGTEAFRPLPGRFQQFRPWVYRPSVYAREEAAVISAIASGRVGAVIRHPLYEFIDPGIRALIERHYAPAGSEHPDVWLPRPRPRRVT